MKEKIYLNRIPVFRIGDEEDGVKYILYEDDEYTGVTLYLNKGLKRIEEYTIILNFIGEESGIKDGNRDGISARRDIIDKK